MDDPVKCCCIDLSGRSRSSSMSEEEIWRTEFFDCLSNKIVCLFVALCPGGACFIQARTTEKATGFRVGVAFCLACFLGCIGMGFNRSNIRKAYLIPGNYLKDCLLHCFCSPCAVCQEHEEVELRLHGKLGGYVPPTMTDVSGRINHI
mmetsp:Transcript_18697/g.33827  ORF Transcript_18697/g.33827 Transcript_18697/m.33827 type:complete len:148 (-) Transcript_18697:1728-2171(-)